MIDIGYASYVPVLRLKQAEYDSMALLNQSAKSQILPHFIIPPASKKDKESGRLFTGEETLQTSAQRVGRFWMNRPSLIDVRFISRWATANLPAGWLINFMQRIEKNSGMPIPVVSLTDFRGSHRREFIDAVIANRRGMAIRLSLSDLGDDELKNKLHQALLSAALKPQECVLLVDFSDADFSSVSEVEDQYRIYFDILYEIGLWSKVIFQGNSYPDQNPCKPGLTVSIPRNDWLAWRGASSEKMFAAHTLFSDFAADNAVFRFDPVAVPAIRHIRYSVPDAWTVYRAEDGSKDQTRLQKIARTIATSSSFAGRNFSWGDRWIDDCAFAAGRPGTSVIWRKVNLTHHFSRVIFDLREVTGFTSEPYHYESRGDQPALLLSS
nr:hypothetical protein [uncultured Rhizobium sp.]